MLICSLRCSAGGSGLLASVLPTSRLRLHAGARGRMLPALHLGPVPGTRRPQWHHQDLRGRTRHHAVQRLLLGQTRHRVHAVPMQGEITNKQTSDLWFVLYLIFFICPSVMQSLSLSLLEWTHLLLSGSNVSLVVELDACGTCTVSHDHPPTTYAKYELCIISDGWQTTSSIASEEAIPAQTRTINQ